MRNEILQCAERLFKVHGYDKTTLQMIANELGITKGAVSYHFKVKWGVFNELFTKYLISLHEYIGKNLKKSYNSNAYLHYSVIYICLFRQFMATPENWQSFYRNEVKTFLQKERFDLFKMMFEKISADFHKDFSEEEIEITCHLGIGAVVKLLKEFDMGIRDMSVDKYCYYYAYLIGVLSRLDEAAIKKNIALAFEFLEGHTPPLFSMFT